MRRLLGLCLVMCSALVTACSSSSGSSASGDGGETPGKDSGGGGGGTSSEVAGGVSFLAGGTGIGSSPFLIDATFLKGSGTFKTSSAVCGTAVDGCQLCGVGDAGISSGTFQMTMESAGTITTKDGSKALTTLSYVSAGTGGTYSSGTSAGLTWSPGDTLSATATGEAFPAFTGSVTAPKDIAGVQPALSLLKSVSAKASDAFVVSWTPSSDNATMQLVVGGMSSSATIGCTADESAGKITVAASLLAGLPGLAGGSGTVSLTKQMSTSVNVAGVSSLFVQASAPKVSGLVSFTK